ncbi:zinc-ribbon domain-containing protein [Chitinophaga sp. LS1]|uniref:zinc-ribbon domain-containing protein n=1 Tax=Chitinophaga sp. LS1 TaxID=3051176 RepID=UPI002AAA840E|nr:zinc-ribbon domain-containing protein [Chitinophaga sp. LS1]WPV69025.1 zinc-ribbon domain-containing protein [Chitinophaga sp. LS1]
MFIFFYGKRRARIKTAISSYEHTCEYCKSNDMRVKVYQTYIHIFWIPFFPVGSKDAEIKCAKCNSPKWNDFIMKKYEASTRTPFYLYTWMLLIPLFIGLIAYICEQNAQHTREYFAKPQVGDLYEMKNPGNGRIVYFNMKITAIKNDSIRFRLEEAAFADNVEYIFLAHDLRKMRDSGLIVQIDRE